MINRLALIAGPLACMLSVLLGAFGAHMIADMVTPERLKTWQTATQYLMGHGLALIVIGILAIVIKQSLKRPCYLIFGGASVFCGTLFSLVLTGVTWLGAITPLGGLLLIAGWLDLSLQLLRYCRTEAL